MDTTVHSTAAPEAATETRSIGDAIDIMHGVRHLIDLLNLAATGIWHDGGDKAEAEALLACARYMREGTDDAIAILYARIGEPRASA